MIFIVFNDLTSEKGICNKNQNGNANQIDEYKQNLLR